MTDLNTLVIFAKVVEANSFSEAARRLKMSISTVSRRVAELEDQLGVRLLERSTRSLRLTAIGTDVFEHAKSSAELSDLVDSIVSNQLSNVAGTIRLSAPPSISDSLLAPLIGAFQAAYPDVRVHVMVTERMVDPIAEGVDLAFRLGILKDSTLVARKLITYRHQLVASPVYLARHGMPETPRDLLKHRLLAFSHWKQEYSWTFFHVAGGGSESVTFQPYIAMNDFAGLVPGLLAGNGIGFVPPIVRPDLVRDGRLVEVMPDWRFQTFDLAIVHVSNRHMPQALRIFKEFALQMVPALFPNLPV